MKKTHTFTICFVEKKMISEAASNINFVVDPGDERGGSYDELGGRLVSNKGKERIIHL